MDLDLSEKLILTSTQLPDGSTAYTFILPKYLYSEREGFLLKSLRSKLKTHPQISQGEFQNLFLKLEKILTILPHDFQMEVNFTYYSDDNSIGFVDFETLTGSITPDQRAQSNKWLLEFEGLEVYGKTLDQIFNPDSDTNLHDRHSYLQVLEKIYDENMGKGAWQAWKIAQNQGLLQKNLPNSLKLSVKPKI